MRCCVRCSGLCIPRRSAASEVRLSLDLTRTVEAGDRCPGVGTPGWKPGVDLFAELYYTAIPYCDVEGTARFAIHTYSRVRYGATSAGGVRIDGNAS